MIMFLHCIQNLTYDDLLDVYYRRDNDLVFIGQVERSMNWAGNAEMLYRDATGDRDALQIYAYLLTRSRDIPIM